MGLNRRTFLKGIVALAGLAATLKVAPTKACELLRETPKQSETVVLEESEVPSYRDDTAYIQYLIDTSNGYCVIPRGHYTTSGKITIRGLVDFSGSRITAMEPLELDCSQVDPSCGGLIFNDNIVVFDYLNRPEDNRTAVRFRA